MTKQLPAERPLPNKQEILDQVLAEQGRPARRSKPWLVPAAAAAAIAALFGSVLIVQRPDQTEPQQAANPGQSTTPTTKPVQPVPAAPADIRINLRRLTPAERTSAAQRCARTTDGRQRLVEAGYGFIVKGPVQGGQNEVIAFLGDGGLRYGCDGRGEAFETAVVGGDAGVAKRRKIVLNVPDATHPAAPTEGNSFSSSIEFDGKPDLLVRESWYRVDERVAAVRQRWIVAGRTGPWYVAEPADGLVFVRSWDVSTALRVGQEVRLETQVLGRRGQLLDAPADQRGGGGLTPSPGTTRVDQGTVTPKTTGDTRWGTITF